jgi:hypothetical protein
MKRAKNKVKVENKENVTNYDWDYISPFIKLNNKELYIFDINSLFLFFILWGLASILVFIITMTLIGVKL